MDAPELAEQLGWTYVERCGGGEFGAHLVARGDDKAILKLPAKADRLASIQGSIELADRVREQGQLAPRYYDVGVMADAVYTLQERVEGDLPEVLTLAHAQRMIELLESHAGAAEGWGERPAGFTAWWDPLATLRDAGGAVAEWGDEIAPVLARPPGAVKPAGDVIHDDYHMRNVLVREDEVLAIIDWEGAKQGDRRFDTFTLSWWLRAVPQLTTPEAAAWVTRHVDSVLADDELAFCAASTALRNLDFYTRHNPAALDDFCLAAVERVLAPYWRH